MPAGAELRVHLGHGRRGVVVHPFELIAPLVKVFARDFWRMGDAGVKWNLTFVNYVEVEVMILPLCDQLVNDDVVVVNDREVARTLREAWSRIPPGYRDLVSRYFKHISDVPPTKKAGGRTRSKSKR